MPAVFQENARTSDSGRNLFRHKNAHEMLPVGKPQQKSVPKRIIQNFAQNVQTPITLGGNAIVRKKKKALTAMVTTEQWP